jgi:glycoside/pentoside/hexuronide:cation symporter, GPH family
MKARSGWRSSLAVAAYAAPGVPEAMLLYCAGLVLPGFYTQEGVDVKVIGSVMVVARLFDATIDPVIGHLSDRAAAIFGSRRPWLLAGAVVSSIAAWFLYTPPPKVTGLYYLAWTLCLYFGWTMAIIPYDAWGADISSDYLERAKIFGYRGVAYYAGSLLFLCTPFFGLSKEVAFNREVLHFNAIMIAVLFAITVPLAFRFAPKARASKVGGKVGYVEMLTSVRRNRPMLLFLAIYALSGLGLGIFLALSYVYVVNYLKLPEAFPAILLGYAVANVLAIPVWMRVINRIGKHRAWAIAAFADALLYPCLAPLPPGASSYVPVLVLIVLSGAADAVGRVAADSILGDIIDYERLRTGVDRTANYFALKSVVTKANMALGGGVAFFLIGFFGYAPSSSTNSRAGIVGFLVTFLLIPSIFNILSGVFMWRFPIDRHRQSIVKRRLDARAVRAARDATRERTIAA